MSLEPVVSSASSSKRGMCDISHKVVASLKQQPFLNDLAAKTKARFFWQTIGSQAVPLQRKLIYLQRNDSCKRTTDRHRSCPRSNATLQRSAGFVNSNTIPTWRLSWARAFGWRITHWTKSPTHPTPQPTPQAIQPNHGRVGCALMRFPTTHAELLVLERDARDTEHITQHYNSGRNSHSPNPFQHRCLDCHI